MADFWSGFSRGFQPYGANAADLISRAILNNAYYDKQNKDKQKIEQEKAFRESLLNQQYDQIETEVKGGDFTNFTKLPPERRVAVNQYIDHTEPKVKYESVSVPGQGLVTREITIPKDGGDPQIRDLYSSPIVEKEEITYDKDGNKITSIKLTGSKESIIKKTEEARPETSKEKAKKPTALEVFYDEDTDTRAYQEDWRGKITTYKSLRQTVASLKPTIPEMEQFTPTYLKAKSKADAEYLNIRNNQLSLLPEKDLADRIQKLSDEKADKQKWDMIFDAIKNKYYEDGVFDGKELKAFWVLDTLFELEFGETSNVLRNSGR